MFFRRKRRQSVPTPVVRNKSKGAVPGSADVVEAKDTDIAAIEAAAESVSEQTEDTKSNAAEGEAREPGTAIALTGNDEIRLFPGFERDDFEVGFRADQEHPSLVMRWKDSGSNWFKVPALFNRSVLAAMDERDSASDLNRLLRNYGYDVEAVTE